MEKIRIVYVISTVDFSYGLKWLAEYMPADRYDVTFVFLYHKSPALHEILLSKNIRSYYYHYDNKGDLFNVIRRLMKLFGEIKPHIVHAHLFEATFAGLIASLLKRVPVRIHTRHHASLHHDQFPRAVWVDRFINLLSHRIVSISKNVHQILLEQDKAPARKIVMVHHGFDFSEFEINQQQIEFLRIKYHLVGCRPVIGVVSRFTSFKGLQFIIPAFKNLLVEFPNAVLIMANAIGDYTSVLTKLLEEIPEANYRLITFEQNVFALYKCFDVFVHAPVNEHVEAFGQIYVEAMALEVPVVCSLSGIAAEYIVDRENAVTVPFCNSEKITDAFKLLLSNESLRYHVTQNGYRDVHHLFDIHQMILKLDKIYQELLFKK